MASQSPRTALSPELLYQVVNQVKNPTDLVNLSCTCSTMDSIINYKPLRLYEINAQFHFKEWDRRLYFQTKTYVRTWRKYDRKSIKKEYERGGEQKERPSTVPSLVHVIRTEPLEHIEKVLRVFQKTFGTRRINRKCAINLTTPVEAAIRYGRVDVLYLLMKHKCDFLINLKSLDEKHQIARLERGCRDIGIRRRTDMFKLTRPYLLALLCNQYEAALFFFERLSEENTRNELINYEFYAWYMAIQTRNERISIELLPRVKGQRFSCPTFQNEALNWAVSINSLELVHGILATSTDQALQYTKLVLTSYIYSSNYESYGGSDLNGYLSDFMHGDDEQSTQANTNEGFDTLTEFELNNLSGDHDEGEDGADSYSSGNSDSDENGDDDEDEDDSDDSYSSSADSRIYFDSDWANPDYHSRHYTDSFITSTDRSWYADDDNHNMDDGRGVEDNIDGDTYDDNIEFMGVWPPGGPPLTPPKIIRNEIEYVTFSENDYPNPELEAIVLEEAVKHNAIETKRFVLQRCGKYARAYFRKLIDENNEAELREFLPSTLTCNDGNHSTGRAHLMKHVRAHFLKLILNDDDKALKACLPPTVASGAEFSAEGALLMENAVSLGSQKCIGVLKDFGVADTQ
ncbi:hypothetical protein GGR58DRAFT_524485 [Xylaria digitata]|nr:hypothetical protein GGR58DRAFT_524485 [Xylaria digitata]